MGYLTFRQMLDSVCQTYDKKMGKNLRKNDKEKEAK